MEVKQINQLMVAMRNHGIKRVSIEREGVKIEIEREAQAPSFSELQELLHEENPMRMDFEKHKIFRPLRGENIALYKNEAKGEPDSLDKDDEICLFVTSPMVGTVYHAPSPSDPSFIKVGDKIEKNSVVCIIEAMKVMNEVKAGVSGVVQEILIDNSQPVEFGTKLIRVLPQ